MYKYYIGMILWVVGSIVTYTSIDEWVEWSIVPYKSSHMTNHIKLLLEGAAS